VKWRKSSYSGGNGGNCIEVGGGKGTVAVRDTKQADRGPRAGVRPGRLPASVR